MRLASRVSPPVPKKLRDEIESLAAITGDDKSTLMRKLMLKGLEQLKLDTGIESYVKGKTSLEKSSKIAGVSIWRFLEELTNQRLAYDTNSKMLKRKLLRSFRGIKELSKYREFVRPCLPGHISDM